MQTHFRKKDLSLVSSFSALLFPSLRCWKCLCLHVFIDFSGQTGSKDTTQHHGESESILLDKYMKYLHLHESRDKAGSLCWKCAFDLWPKLEWYKGGQFSWSEQQPLGNFNPEGIGSAHCTRSVARWWRGQSQNLTESTANHVTYLLSSRRCLWFVFHCFLFLFVFILHV